MSSIEEQAQTGSRKRGILVLAAIIIIIAIVVLSWRFIINSGPSAQTEPYEETFDVVETWTAGEGVNAEGSITEGVYEMSVELSGDIFWATAGQTFAGGEYEVEATPLEGAVDNGYGMLFHVDDEENSFYVFKVSSDGYVFIGRCADSCLEQQVLVDQDWFASSAVQQGLDVTNKLRVVVSGPDMIFFVNDEEVGRASDDTLKKGDIGLMAETFTPGGLRVTFDNFTVMPIETD